MTTKRLIFTLLYDSGSFMLSRNFRLQRVGNLKWLEENYGFGKVGSAIDELIVLDVSRQPRNIERFCEDLKLLTLDCFAPIAAGGGVRSVDHARLLLRSGADKVVVNTAIYDQPELVENLGKEFGAQCLVASIDCEHNNGMFVATKKNSFELTNHTLADSIKICARLPIGEIYLNSIARDGTGNGLHLEILDHLPANLTTPLILMGGVGNSKHIVEGLRDSRVDAVATANLLNFMGDGLSRARRNVINEGIDLANFD